jgi:phosphate:Na+ symporter
MLNLLNLLAAIALLVWGTHMVRTGVLRVIGGKLRDVLARGDNQRPHEPRYLNATALGTPTLAIACAAREAMHQADIVEGMLRGIMPVIRDNNAALSQQLR